MCGVKLKDRLPSKELRERLGVDISDTARDLGVVIDLELSLVAHVTAVCRSGYNQLCQLRPVVQSLSVNATKTLVQAFISCRLDYCLSLIHI